MSEYPKEIPLDTFMPAPNSGLVAWFADFGRETPCPIVGYFISYAFDTNDGPPTPDVEPAVMADDGSVDNLRLLDRTFHNFIGVYPVGVKPDAEKIRRARERVQRNANK